MDGWMVFMVKTDNTAYQALVLVWLWCGNLYFAQVLPNSYFSQFINLINLTQLNSTCPELGTAQPQLVLNIKTFLQVTRGRRNQTIKKVPKILRGSFFWDALYSLDIKLVNCLYPVTISAKRKYSG